ncbi:putative uncharacterized protein [Parachlamydia acanthamoebae UV-7]|uniref:Uncharacterized protein n=2 Tax=Parachlamydia acanthamoebae TaxID=83552 RepID=F8L256_PARAV|nr:HAD family phosphatase [Parachlamydia acanthamoebae]EFB41270.1 hypothetical protein pah_c047o034 [Parachlamydia acanthamoebae str. Hall's coccus]CCB87385.1 putative uncharacterized protein [Parachlamydia acanthamoebae UV-7]
MYKLVIFDCDGVLVDSEMIANRIDAEALTAIGYPITAEESIKQFVGMSTKSVCEKILNESGCQISPHFFSEQQTAVLEAFKIELCSLIEPVLEFLTAQSIMRCVASSSSKERIFRSLEITDQIRFFETKAIFSSQQVSRGKPAPDLFLLAANQMGCAPAECLVIEDSSAGIQAALTAGMDVVGFMGGSHAGYDWYQQKVIPYDIPMVYHQNELLEWIKKHFLSS